MRTKTQRAYKRLLHEYSLGFGLRTPYQILVDAEFCKEAAKQKLDINVEFEKTFQDPTRHFITECSIQELRRQSQGSFEAQQMAKQFERRRCPHTHAPIAGAECISQVVGPSNEYNYIVASQDDTLREKLRAISGIPMVYVKAHMVVMEQMSTATKKFLEKKEAEKKGLSTKEKYQVDKMLHQDYVPKKKRKIKGPNPLSVKKKKKIAPPPPKKKNQLSDGAIEKKRKRPVENQEESQKKEESEKTENIPNPNENGEQKKKRRRRKKTKHDKEDANET
ncbi:Fcf1-domain-containing protein [Phascolomyces articulosus]|uniref:U three protein 23 n=1 Tax=Phascolomyces articulosus TaxID=60185 RepID=A0AAD5K8K6_9FUNG|nr:Fcf1-domain-containing protein [Phascolomyces articulosus]